MHGWCHESERRTSLCTGLTSRKLCRFLLLFSTGFTSLSVLLLFPRICARFLILFHVTQMRFSRSTHLLIFLSLETLTSIISSTYPGGTDWPGELCYNFSISNNFTQMVNFTTWIPGCDSHGPALLDWFISSATSICSTIAFHLLGNSDHLVSVSIDFPSNSQQDDQIHCIIYDYSHADWGSLQYYLRDVPWKDIFKLGACAAASEFCEWVQVGIDLYIPHRK